MTGSALLWWFVCEAAAIAIAYPVVVATGCRRRVLAVIVCVHTVVAACVLFGRGEVVSQVVVSRAVMLAEVAGACALTACMLRWAREPAVAVALSTILILMGVVAPVPAEGLARLQDSGARTRSVAAAVSPAFAATRAHEKDVLRLNMVYEKTPAAVMEIKMHSPFWTVGIWSAAALVFGMLGFVRRRRYLCAAVSIAVLLPLVSCKKSEEPKPRSAAKSAAVKTPPKPSDSPKPAALDRAKVTAAIERGERFLLESKNVGGWLGGHPGISAMAAHALLTKPTKVVASDAKVAQVIASLAKLAKKDGGIYDQDSYSYVTALSLLAFVDAGMHADLVKAAAKWLAGSQFQETSGTKKDNVNYGGIGYGRSGDADLSNLHFALQALKESHFKDNPDVYMRAIKFVERCQNRSESNDQSWASNDGGFVYKPGASKAGGTKSSGSMTYAGINAFVYADVDATDPRVTSAAMWVSANFSVDENPGLGNKGLYYYYHMMSRALSLIKADKIRGPDGVDRDWYAELANKLMSLQASDGSWKNPDETYRESNQQLATARALLALKFGFPK